MKCENCGIEFEPKIDTDARFHSDACRTQWWNQYRKINKVALDAHDAIEKLMIFAKNSPNSRQAESADAALKELLDKLRLRNI
jgi:hypothetical protein